MGTRGKVFGTLAAVYGSGIGLEVTSIALFSSIPILIGAVSQIPVGILSDRLDRRKVLVGVAAVALLADISFVLVSPESRMVNIALAGLFGGAIFAMYPVIIAHANDHADGNFIRISGGLLLVFGVGSIIGPLVAGWAMSAFGSQGLFLTTAVAHVLIILQAIYRISKRAPIAFEEKSGFKAGPLSRGTTPQTIALSATEAEVDEATATSGEAPPDAPPEPEPAGQS